MERYPAFIVGSPRSGTSMLVDALQSGGYKGYREGLFLSLIEPLNRVIDRHFLIHASDQKKNMISAIDKAAFKQKIFDIFRAEACDLNPGAPWFDKTGNAEMISAIPILLELWPDGVFIFAKRRAIENIISRQKKFPGRGFEEHCIGWTKTMHAWRTVRSRLSAQSFIEIDQQDMLRAPDVVARDLCRFLALDPTREAVLQGKFRSNRPQETETGSASRVYSLASCGWTRHQIHLFLSHCKAEMEAYGYSMEEDYSRPSAPVTATGPEDGPHATTDASAPC